jgi:hypothetical protein
LWRLHCKTGRKKWIYSWPAWLFPINHSYLVLIYYGVFCFLVIVKYLWSPITQILHSITWSCLENGVLLSYQRLLRRKARMDLIDRLVAFASQQCLFFFCQIMKAYVYLFQNCHKYSFHFTKIVILDQFKVFEPQLNRSILDGHHLSVHISIYTLIILLASYENCQIISTLNY